MTSALDHNAALLGDGEIILLDSGEPIFKMASFTDNPVVKPQDLGLTWEEEGQLKVGAVFNGGAEILGGGVILAPRCHRGYRRGTFPDEKLGITRHYFEDYVSQVWILSSEDGVHFAPYQDMVIRGDGTAHGDFTYGIEDMRIVRYGARYLLVGCGKIKPPFKGADADRIAVYSTEDFLHITYHGAVGSFDSRNAIPFGEQVRDRYYMLLRFHPHIHLEVLEAGVDQLLNPSRYLKEWQKIYDHRHQNLLLEAGRYLHEREKIGPGAPVVRTERGWLLIYHAVGEIGEELCRAYGLDNKIERGYSVCAALLDLDEPSKVLRRTRYPIYIPSAPYELYGDDQYPVDVPGVVFPVGALVLGGKLLLYAGAGDKYVILLSCSLERLIDYLWWSGEVIGPPLRSNVRA